MIFEIEEEFSRILNIVANKIPAIKTQDNLDIRFLRESQYTKYDNGKYILKDPLGNILHVEKCLVKENPDGTITLDNFVNKSFHNKRLKYGTLKDMSNTRDVAFPEKTKIDYMLVNSEWVLRDVPSP